MPEVATIIARSHRGEVCGRRSKRNYSAQVLIHYHVVKDGPYLRITWYAQPRHIARRILNAFVYIFRRAFFMSVTIISAIIGALIGGSLTLIGIVITLRFQAKQKETDDKRWKAELYAQTKLTAIANLHSALIDNYHSTLYYYSFRPLMEDRLRPAFDVYRASRNISRAFSGLALVAQQSPLQLTNDVHCTPTRRASSKRDPKQSEVICLWAADFRARLLPKAETLTQAYDRARIYLTPESDEAIAEHLHIIAKFHDLIVDLLYQDEFGTTVPYSQAEQDQILNSTHLTFANATRVMQALLNPEFLLEIPRSKSPQAP